MKQTVIFFFMGFIMFSCKKNYDCTCTASNNGVTASSSFTIHETSKNAQSTCDQKASSVSAGPGSTTTCKIEEE